LFLSSNEKTHCPFELEKQSREQKNKPARLNPYHSRPPYSIPRNQIRGQDQKTGKRHLSQILALSGHVQRQSEELRGRAEKGAPGIIMQAAWGW
jgi:hypothetical protein